MADMDHSLAFWRSVADTYKPDYPSGVLFDLFNEPFGISWSQWKNGDTTWAGMDDLIGAVRSTGATNWVVANGMEWGNDLSGWLAHRPVDPAGRLVAGAHVYCFNAYISVSCWDADYKPVAAQVPFLITEMGENDCAHAFVDRLFAWSDGNRWGRILTLDLQDNASYSCSGGPGLVSDNAGTPTAYGVGVRSYYLAHRSP